MIYFLIRWRVPCRATLPTAEGLPSLNIFNTKNDNDKQRKVFQIYAIIELHLLYFMKGRK